MICSLLDNTEEPTFPGNEKLPVLKQSRMITVSQIFQNFLFNEPPKISDRVGKVI